MEVKFVYHNVKQVWYDENYKNKESTEENSKLQKNMPRGREWKSLIFDSAWHIARTDEEEHNWNSPTTLEAEKISNEDI